MGDVDVERVRLSERWTRVVWLASLGTAAILGAATGGELTKTVAGSLFGILTAVPAGAVVAVTCWTLGVLFLEAFGPELSGWPQLTFRVSFGVMAGGLVALEIAVALAMLRATPDAIVEALAPAAAVAVVGIAYPPRRHRGAA
jgi:hypothetical protein